MKKLIIITGPTASGKTALAIKLAKQFNGEIISELTGLSGKELGSFIQEFIHRVIEERDNSTKINWVAIHSKEEIISKIIQFKSQLDE